MSFIELTTIKDNPILINPSDVFFFEEVRDDEDSKRYTLISFRPVNGKQIYNSLMVKESVLDVRIKLRSLDIGSA